jgi:nitrate reductase gamma subunit
MSAGLWAYAGMLVGTVVLAGLLGFLFNRIFNREDDDG